MSDAHAEFGVRKGKKAPKKAAVEAAEPVAPPAAPVTAPVTLAVAALPPPPPPVAAVSPVGGDEPSNASTASTKKSVRFDVETPSGEGSEAKAAAEKASPVVEEAVSVPPDVEAHLPKHRFYERDFPEQDEFVVVKVQSIEEMGAYVTLLEYDGVQGMILLSELSRRRIRSIHKLLRVGRNEIVMVIRGDKDKSALPCSGSERVCPHPLSVCACVCRPLPFRLH